MTKTAKVQKKVQVWIYLRNPNEGRYDFLLLKTRPDRGGFWQPVTGSVEPGETVENAAMREAKEESGLQFSGEISSINPDLKVRVRDCRGGVLNSAPLSAGSHPALKGEVSPALKIEFQSRGRTVHEFCFSIEAPADAEFEVRLDPHEHVEYQWAPVEVAMKILGFPSNAQVLEKLVKQLSSLP